MMMMMMMMMLVVKVTKTNVDDDDDDDDDRGGIGVLSISFEAYRDFQVGIKGRIFLVKPLILENVTFTYRVLSCY